MSKLRTSFALLDPGHVFDGLFVPTQGRSRGRLLVSPRRFGSLEIGFQGYEQLGADDQSFLLALTAQLGIEKRVIEACPAGQIGAELRRSLDLNLDEVRPVATKAVSLRSLLVDAGYHPSSSTNRAWESLNRLRATQIREIDRETGWDRVCNLVSVSINRAERQIYVAANPRLTAALFGAQFVPVSLLERNLLETDVGKILHCWLSSNIRPGQSLGNGNGAHLETLGARVWGPTWSGSSRQQRGKRRGLIRDALAELAQKTNESSSQAGWQIDLSHSEIMMISRPRTIARTVDKYSPNR